MKIEDPYYLQQTQTGDAPTTRLLRRGSELHAPASRMLLPRSAILFVEDLRDESPFALFMRNDRG